MHEVMPSATLRTTHAATKITTFRTRVGFGGRATGDCANPDG
jgi:hypothetical protein